MSLNGGILIIGSLLWDDNDIRLSWRDEDLIMDKMIPVKAPIRYGKLSPSRSNTYTMVFSSACEGNQSGNGVFLPFSKAIEDYEELKKTSLAVIRAERNQQELPNKYFHWNWGALVIAWNPKYLTGNLENREMFGEINKRWIENYRPGFDPEQYRVGNESPILNKQGELLIRWPEELDDYAFLIATATKPGLTVYPSSEQIAEVMYKNNYDQYFSNNLKHGITTFQDEEVRSFLNTLNQHK